MMYIKEDLLLWFINFLIKSRKVVVLLIIRLKKNRRPLDLAALQLTEELRKPIHRNFKRRTVYSRFKDNVWGGNLSDMQLISKFNKGFRFLFVLLIFFVNMLGLFLRKIKKVLVLLILFKRSQINQDVNRTKYGLIKDVNFTIILLKNG